MRGKGWNDSADRTTVYTLQCSAPPAENNGGLACGGRRIWEEAVLLIYLHALLLPSLENNVDPSVLSPQVESERESLFCSEKDTNSQRELLQVVWLIHTLESPSWISNSNIKLWSCCDWIVQGRLATLKTHLIADWAISKMRQHHQCTDLEFVATGGRVKFLSSV